MKSFFVSATMALVLGLSGSAQAICGDVTGDDKKTTADALAVLRSSVGQQVNLVCEDSGPSRLRYYNAFDCGNGSDISTLDFNGFEFSADAFDYSPYQTVDRLTIDNFHVTLCGGDYYFDGPSYLARNRSIYLFVVLADPDVYDFPGVEVPAFLVLFDEGIPASGATLTTAEESPALGSGQEAAVFSGGLRRSDP